jgi:hypothetical protein
VRQHLSHCLCESGHQDEASERHLDVFGLQGEEVERFENDEWIVFTCFFLFDYVLLLIFMISIKFMLLFSLFSVE